MFANSLLKLQETKITPNPSKSHLIREQFTAVSCFFFLSYTSRSLDISELIFPSYLYPKDSFSVLPAPYQTCCAFAVQHCSLPWASCDPQPPLQPVLTQNILGWESRHTAMYQLRMLLPKHTHNLKEPLLCLLPGLGSPPRDGSALQRTKLHQVHSAHNKVGIAFKQQDRDAALQRDGELKPNR